LKVETQEHMDITSCLCNKPLLTGTVMKKLKLQGVCLCSKCAALLWLVTKSLLIYQTSVSVQGLYNACTEKVQALYQTLFSCLIIKEKKWSGYTRLRKTHYTVWLHFINYCTIFHKILPDACVEHVWTNCSGCTGSHHYTTGSHHYTTGKHHYTQQELITTQQEVITAHDVK